MFSGKKHAAFELKLAGHVVLASKNTDLKANIENENQACLVLTASNVRIASEGITMLLFVKWLCGKLRGCKGAMVEIGIIPDLVRFVACYRKSPWWMRYD